MGGAMTIVAGRTGRSRASLQAFSKHFQRNVVPMPSFSKDSFGGFVEFQEVTIDPNEK
jgi:hypothetical protein